MKTFQFPFLLVILLLAGCAHTARHYTPPSHAAVDAAVNGLHMRIAEAKVTARKAQISLSAAKVLADTESDHIAATSQKLDALYRNAPPELREQIAQAQSEVAEIKKEHAEMVARIAETEQNQAEHEKQLNNEIPNAEKVVAEADAHYSTDVVALAQHANEAEAGWHHDSAQIVSMVKHNVLIWIIGILVIAGIVGGLVLKFASRV